MLSNQALTLWIGQQQKKIEFLIILCTDNILPKQQKWYSANEFSEQI